MNQEERISASIVFSTPQIKDRQVSEPYANSYSYGEHGETSPRIRDSPLQVHP